MLKKRRITISFAIAALLAFSLLMVSSLAMKVNASDIPSVANVKVTGNGVIGDVLTAVYDYTGLDEGNTQYQWFIASPLTTFEGLPVNATYTAITGANNRTYTIAEGDLGKYIRVDVTPKDTNNNMGATVRSTNYVSVTGKKIAIDFESDEGSTGGYSVQALINAGYNANGGNISVVETEQNNYLKLKTGPTVASTKNIIRGHYSQFASDFVQKNICVSVDYFFPTVLGATETVHAILTTHFGTTTATRQLFWGHNFKGNLLYQGNATTLGKVYPIGKWFTVNTYIFGDGRYYNEMIVDGEASDFGSVPNLTSTFMNVYNIYGLSYLRHDYTTVQRLGEMYIDNINISETLEFSEETINAARNEAIDYTFDAKKYNNAQAEIIYSVVGDLPAGLNLNGQTGKLTGFVNQAGTHKINVKAEYEHVSVIKEFEINVAQSDKTLNANFNLNVLTVEAVSNVNYQYQFWIKTKTNTDNSDNQGKEHYIWQMFRAYSINHTATLNVGTNEMYINEGCYEVIVRIKDLAGNLVNEIHKKYDPQAINQTKIETIVADGISGESLYVIDKSKGNCELIVFGNNAANTKYSLYKNNNLIEDNNISGVFSLDVSSYNNGYYNLKAVANNGVSIDEKTIRVYVYGSYNANEIAVIKSISGTSNESGLTTYKMELTYANGTNINATNIDENYDIILKSDNQLLINPQYSNNVNGVLEATFTVDYNNKYGIYRINGSVKRKNQDFEDDTVILYYSGYTRDGYLTQTGNSTSQAGEAVNITANGSLDNYSGTLFYAFYREDASGWVLIKDYATGNTLTWTPTRAGLYNIQTRLKAEGAGSYEKVVSKVYTITNSGLSSGILTVKSYDYVTGLETDIYQPGKPYKITAEFTGTEENILYMFTVYNVNTGLIYLNHYSTSNSIMFAPNKSDTFIITARIIKETSFGFKDLSENLTIVSSLN